MAVTLGDLDTLIRKFTGYKTTTQLSTALLYAEVNNYYQNVLPLQLYLPECKGTCTLTTADTDTSKDLPDDTLKIFPPVRIGSGATPSSYNIGGYYDEEKGEDIEYYTKHDGSEDKGTPLDILLKGRTVEFAPTADGIFKILFPSIEKPTELTSSTDEIVQDRLRDIIAVSASIELLLQLSDEEHIASLVGIYPFFSETLSGINVPFDLKSINAKIKARAEAQG